MRLIFDFIMFCKTGFIEAGKIYFISLKNIVKKRIVIEYLST